MDKNIKTIFIEGNEIHMKQDSFGYRVVHPIKNKDGSINWINFFFGGKRNLLILSVYILIAVLFYFGVAELIDQYKIIANNPCDFCPDCFTVGKGGDEPWKNLSSIVAYING